MANDSFNRWNNAYHEVKSLLNEITYASSVQSGSAEYEAALSLFSEMLQFLDSENIIDGFNVKELFDTLEAWAQG